MEHAVRVFSKIGSRGFERDDEDLRRIAGMSYDRGLNPAAGAAPARGDHPLRRPDPAAADDHGADAGHPRRKDRMVPTSGGRATARAIPGARLLVIEGMGHDMPRGAWPQMLDAIEQNAARAGETAAVR